MSIKTIAIKASVYEKLAKEKQGSESFTRVIERLLANNTRKGTCGDAVASAKPFWPKETSVDQEADLMEALIHEKRSFTRWEIEKPE